MMDYNNYTDNTNYYLPTSQSYGQNPVGYSSPYYQVNATNMPMGYYQEAQPAYYSLYLPPPKPLMPFKTEGEDSEKLLGLIEKQTEVIGHLNSKILNQESKKILWEKRQLKIRLRQLEQANAVKQRELEARMLTRPLIKIPPRPKIDTESPRKANKEQSNKMLQLLHRLVLEKDASANSNKENKVKKPKLFETLLYGLNPQRTDSNILGNSLIQTRISKAPSRASRASRKTPPRKRTTSIVMSDEEGEEEDEVDYN